MRKTAGFTLIELVIVIVILGILGAVAAPRFINLQGDAYGANVKALKGSIQSAATLANTRAILDGKENVDATAAADSDTAVTGFDEVVFVSGFPAVGTSDEKWSDGILGALQDVDTSAYVITDVASSDPAAITISPKNRNKSTCLITYTQAKDSTPAKIEADASGCESAS